MMFLFLFNIKFLFNLSVDLINFSI